jgi:hypothetical protein
VGQAAALGVLNVLVLAVFVGVYLAAWRRREREA